jgi:hypothetical protein
MWKLGGFLCLVTLAAGRAAGQTTTEEGIRAMLRGDYKDAARILRPLADDASRPDPVAQFFLGILYDTGHAGGNNPRACRLFRQAASREHPFAEQAAALAAQLEGEFGGGDSPFCRPDGTWQGGPPQAFQLGADHRVVFTDAEIRVTHADREGATLFQAPANGRLLPIAYTPVDVTAPTATRRHLFHWFVWMPDGTASGPAWTLGWMISEVRGDQWIPLHAEQRLALAEGPAPPSTYRTSDLIAIRVNAKGEATVTIRGGPTSRTEVLPWPAKQ